MSKFAGLFDEPKAEPKKRESAKQRQEARKKKPAPVAQPNINTKAGRPKGSSGGKRSDARYAAITAYVLTDVLDKLKSRLVEENRRAGRKGQEKHDMSDLINEAFKKYLDT